MSENDFLKLLQKLSLNISREEAHRLFALIDADHSGTISSKEAAAWFKHEPPVARKKK
jgi:Ca2+-binding EF-hand superfamily protein